MVLITSGDQLIPAETNPVSKPGLSGVLQLLLGQVATDDVFGIEEDQKVNVGHDLALMQPGFTFLPLDAPDRGELTPDTLQTLEEGI
jgi:hypothetical protein